LPEPKQGHLLVPLSIGCLTLTPIGATYWALCIRLARAVAFAPTVTVLTPKSFEKTPVAGFVSLTVIVSFVPTPLEKVTPDGRTPPPFLFAYCMARVLALAVSYGRACAPASAAASAVDCAARLVRYQEPTSRTSAAIPNST